MFDNIFIERLWRSLKYEDIYLHDYATGLELERGLNTYFAIFTTMSVRIKLIATKHRMRSLQIHRAQNLQGESILFSFNDCLDNGVHYIFALV